ncbi:hypothetical protein [Pseudoduganella lutea]|uniref:DUF4911 domain-containing protein n=1 Tax=Pseudoduganella lutea TaxID=321985 RepID=A0A4P6L218_9BURK|nr:hypothetical protein [Pseudoduganella lutea]QBE65606.1 hypothetical protein EWM63_23605 [Pseudoduganella lutea]
MTCTENERTALLSIFAAFPGVIAAIDGMHPVGGYRVNCIIPRQAFDAVMLELEENGWLSAI